MKFALVVAVLVLAATVNAGVENLRGESDKPSFCHGIDCPDFKVVKKTDTYEIRDYPETTWASISEELIDGSMSSATSNGFKALFKYISGANEEKRKVDMTAPVRVLTKAGAGPFCESKITVSFFVPDSVSPPKPTGGKVFIEKTPATRVAVRVYGGYSKDDDVKNNIASLAENLQKDGVEVEESFYAYAGYDSPFRFLNRHNEVWVPVK